jgi:Concanavalin A-like lectin/glucanases superfamily
MASSNIYFASSNQIYNFDPFANGFTFETWVNFQSFYNCSTGNVAGSIPSLITLRGDIQAPCSLFSFGTTNTGNLCAYWNNGAAAGAIGSNVLAINQWYHIAAAAAPASGTLRLFINGVQDTAVSIPPSLSAANANGGYLVMGQYAQTYFTNAYFSNTRLIYGSAIYNSASGFFVPNTALTATPPNIGTGKCILLLRAPGGSDPTIQSINNVVTNGQGLIPGNGGTVSYFTVGGYSYVVHTFTAAGTFTLYQNKTCDILVVGGGGCGGHGLGTGGAGNGGGGGGGAVQLITNQLLTATTYAVTIGAGSTSGLLKNTDGTQAGASQFGNYPPSKGGGCGGWQDSTAPAYFSGGNGGGAHNSQGTGGTATQFGGYVVNGGGYPGGSSYVGGTYPSGGGGGAGGAGVSGNSLTMTTFQGTGGPGWFDNYFNTNTVYGKGGDGSLYTLSGTYPYGIAGVAGAANTGNGGGGGNNTAVGGNGGSGIVIVRYVANQFTITNTVSPPACPLDSLSSAALAYSRGLYAIRRLLTSYTGPVVNLRRSNDNAILDFFADSNGNLGGYYNGNWISAANWITAISNTATAYVTVWYDQSGNGNHAKQMTTTTLQPSYNANFRVVDFYTPNTGAYMLLPANTFPSNNQNQTVTLKIGVFSGGAGYCYIWNSGTNAANTANTAEMYTSKYLWSAYGANISSTTTTNPGDVITFKLGTTQYLYVNGTLQATTTQTVSGSTTTTNDVLCASNSNGATQGAYPFNGQLYYITVFSVSLSAADQKIVELL